MPLSRHYFGDGVYASFNGYEIELTANGIGPEATDRIVLSPSMVGAIRDWAANGYRDYNTGARFFEDDQEPSSDRRWSREGSDATS